MAWNRNISNTPAMSMDRQTPRKPPGGPASYPREPGDENDPEMAWSRNRSSAPAMSMERETPVDRTAAWAMAPDDETEDGRAPKPAGAPEEDDSTASEEPEKPKGIVIPVWSMLTLGMMGSVIGSGQGPTAKAPPPAIVPEGNPSVLPDLPVVPQIPCVEDAACGYVMGAIDPVLPPQTRALVNVPGTCQNWSREWLRTGKDIMEFQVDRIRQRFTMALIYCEFNGDNWLEGELWVSDLHECDWYTMIGVDPCGRDEQYQILRNYGQQMRGTLPPEISMMSSLWEITFSDNLLTGTIPSTFAKLSELDTLSLSFNLFKGEIPPFVWEFEDMIYLDLAYNFFTGTIPQTVDLTEPNLQTLLLENNDLDGQIPDSFGNLDWKRLHLDGNQFTGTIPGNLNAPRVQEVTLHNNKLTGKFPTNSFANEHAGRKSKLTTVTLEGNSLTNTQAEMEEMCRLFDSANGVLKTLRTDIACSCCTTGP